MGYHEYSLAFVRTNQPNKVYNLLGCAFLHYQSWLFTNRWTVGRTKSGQVNL